MKEDAEHERDKRAEYSSGKRVWRQMRLPFQNWKAHEREAFKASFYEKAEEKTGAGDAWLKSHVVFC
jgi:hypothetical protein